MPMLIIASDVAASATVECITSGAITPATKPLAMLPMKAWKLDAMPRRSGTRSSTISVTTGTISAQPKAKIAIGNRAHAAVRREQQVERQVEQRHRQHDHEAVADLVLGLHLARPAGPRTTRRP